MGNLVLQYYEKNGVISLRSCLRNKKIALLLLLLFGVFFVCASYQSDWLQKKLFYPYPYRELIAEYAKAENLERSLVAGVILSESKFKNEARSHKGALGLMQLMPDTAKWIAEQMEDDAFLLEELNDPEINIRFGTWYLNSLRQEFKGNEVLMLAAYNAGRGNVKEWMKKYQWDMNFSDIQQIPFKETREYVAKVLKSKQKYDLLYEK